MIIHNAQEVGLKQSAPLMYEVDATFDDVDISKRNTYAFNSQSLWQKNEYFRSQKFLLVLCQDLVQVKMSFSSS